MWVGHVQDAASWWLYHPFPQRVPGLSQLSPQDPQLPVGTPQQGWPAQPHLGHGVLGDRSRASSLGCNPAMEKTRQPLLPGTLWLFRAGAGIKIGASIFTYSGVQPPSSSLTHWCKVISQSLTRNYTEGSVHFEIVFHFFLSSWSSGHI